MEIETNVKIKLNENANFRGVRMEDIAAREDIVQAVVFLKNFDILDGSIIEELARRIIGKLSNDVGLLRYNSHIPYVSNINASFKAYHCPSSDEFINKALNLERHLATCKEKN